MQPGERPAIFGDALRRLTNQAKFMHSDLGRYWYSMSASLNRIAADRAGQFEEALVLMAEALETLGDAYAVYGFSGFGRMQVDFYVAKEFADPFDLETQRRIAAMRPRQSTRMGPAIRHALAKLVAVGDLPAAAIAPMTR